MKNKTTQTGESTPDVPPSSLVWADNTYRFPIDQDLRDCGWKCASHARDGTRTWIHESGATGDTDVAVRITLRANGFDEVSEGGVRVWKIRGTATTMSEGLALSVVARKLKGGASE